MEHNGLMCCVIFVISCRMRDRLNLSFTESMFDSEDSADSAEPRGQTRSASDAVKDGRWKYTISEVMVVRFDSNLPYITFNSNGRLLLHKPGKLDDRDQHV